MLAGLAAIPAGAAAEEADLEALVTGEMRSFALAEREVSSVAFTGPDGAEETLADYEGRVVLVNFWATWCAPCREEMPTLAALQDELGGEEFTVLTVATGRNPPPALTRFLEEIGTPDLPVATDPQQRLARDMAVLGLPVTVLIGADGREVGRLIGGADWASDEAVALIEAVMGEGVPGVPG
ncbi:TlpA family protein disulfide reductase [Pseudoroseicyclus sp. CXY001]|uniref:TlpA family protein disulfide reductase n=1 Tax=Pseudoroseicyclus sp. CXY001 TaxID=3242492 RepID=UPI0035714CEC